MTVDTFGKTVTFALDYWPLSLFTFDPFSKVNTRLKLQRESILLSHLQSQERYSYTKYNWDDLKSSVYFGDHSLIHVF